MITTWEYLRLLVIEYAASGMYLAEWRQPLERGNRFWPEQLQ
jgi:uncharacterized protein YodC (DUF2158 family)